MQISQYREKMRMDSTKTLQLYLEANEVARKEKISNVNQYILKNPRKLTKEQLTAVIHQHEFIEKAKVKLGNLAQKFPLIGPPGVSLEQASSEITANMKSSLLGNYEHILDLTGGFGMDTLSFAKYAKFVTYVEQNEQLAQIVQHNFSLMSVSNVDFQVKSAEIFLDEVQKKYDWVYLDPARRSSENQKLVKMTDLSPNFLELASKIWKITDRILLKLSPMIDLSQVQREVANLREIIVVGIKNEVKEVLLVLEKGWNIPPVIQTINYLNEEKTQIFSFTQKQEERILCAIGDPLTYIYEPNAPILKSGAFQEIGNRFGLIKLANNTHLYTSTALIPDFPGRIFEIQAIHKPKKEVLLKELGKPLFANIISRNFGENGEKIAQKFQIKPKDDVTYLLFTQLKDEKKVVILAKKLV
ncbi:MAG: THUMP-like domain-containing protein [Spirosomataceae bacterium]